jgi:hypothetical protein
MYQQSTHRFVMVRPIGFAFNVETLSDNAFQRSVDISNQEMERIALTEFQRVVDCLTLRGCDVLILDPKDPNATPDAVFPNNWFSFGPNKILSIYPMKADCRAAEIHSDLQQQLTNWGVIPCQTIDLQGFRNQSHYLEGTGSLVLDHVTKRAYMARSIRSDQMLAEKWAQDNNYELITFDTCHPHLPGPIYHTNVVLSILSTVAIICLDVIPSLYHQQLTEHLKRSGKEVIDISFLQMNCFCANVLEVNPPSEDKFVIMSTTAFQAFTDNQKNRLMAHVKIVHVDIPIIERVGGGGVRCMLAEVF